MCFGLGFIGFIGFIGSIGFIGFIGFMGFMGVIGFIGFIGFIYIGFIGLIYRVYRVHRVYRVNRVRHRVEGEVSLDPPDTCPSVLRSRALSVSCPLFRLKQPFSPKISDHNWKSEPRLSNGSGL